MQKFACHLEVCAYLLECWNGIFVDLSLPPLLEAILKYPVRWLLSRVVFVRQRNLSLEIFSVVF